MLEIPEPKPNSVIAWFKINPGTEQRIPYVAMHVKGRGWYLTGKSQYPMHWDRIKQLIDDPAQCYIATSWERIANYTAEENQKSLEQKYYSALQSPQS